MPNTILEKEYAHFYRITLQGYDEEEWENFKEQMGQFPKAYTYDGIDDEEKSICFKFATYKPRNLQEVKKCNKANLRIKRDVIDTISRNIRGGAYFNVRRGTIKKVK